jgi:hypothetical protein
VALFAAALFLALLAVVLSACGARVDVSVDVARAGSGLVTVEVQLAPGTARALEDLQTGVPVADLRQAGWAVVGPRAGPSGTTVISVSHPFSALSQLPTLMADIAGHGAPGGRPFRLAVTEQKGALQDVFSATGTVDLRCDLACFDDPALAARVGYPLGAPAAQVKELFGTGPAPAVTFGFRLLLPGKQASAGSGLRPARGSSVLALSPALGRATPIAARTESVNLAYLRQLVTAVSAGALVVLGTAAWLLLRRRRPRGRRRPRAEVPVTRAR